MSLLPARMKKIQSKMQALECSKDFSHYKSMGVLPDAQKSDTSLNNLSSKLREHSRHSMLSFLSSLPIPVLSILDIEANRFYDRNHQMYEVALLTRCYTQHALRPFIGMDFIDLPTIFQDKSVTSSIPNYF